MPDTAPQQPTPPVSPPPVPTPSVPASAPPAPQPPAAPPAPAAPPPPAPPASATPAASAPPATPAAPAAPESALAPTTTGGPPKRPDAAPPPPLEPLLPKDFKLKLADLPEGAKPDEKALGEFTAIMADPKTTQAEKAQALADWSRKITAEKVKAADEQMQRDRVSDLEKLKGDKKYGGAFYDKTINAARDILAKTEYGPAVSKKLAMYGLDCDPDFVKLFAEFRSLVAEDSTSSRLTQAAPEVSRVPKTQTERVAATYKTNPVVK